MINNFDLGIHGFSGTTINKDYNGITFKLSDQLWKAIKAFGLKNKGINIWVYGPQETVFEIYGHWTSDESKLETKLLMPLK